MKTFKKLVAMLICATLLASLCACGSNNDVALTDGDPDKVPAEPYEIKWYICGTPQEDEATVEKAINEYLKDKINATVDMIVMESGQYKQKMGTMVSSGEAFDIAFCASWMLDYKTNATLGAFVELDQYFDTYLKDIAEIMPAEFIDSAIVGDKRYALPTYKEGATQYGWIYRKDIADKYGIDMTKIKTLEDFEPIAEMLTAEIKAGKVDLQYPIDWDSSAGYQEYMYDHGLFSRYRNARSVFHTTKAMTPQKLFL